ncbi:hypothetical protein J4437_02195 [Candidatus Woesearchaeota archaeon]|nr:hypothetical protein [Candidatus Woesearchaeota archaeon]
MTNNNNNNNNNSTNLEDLLRSYGLGNIIKEKYNINEKDKLYITNKNKRLEDLGGYTRLLSSYLNIGSIPENKEYKIISILEKESINKEKNIIYNKKNYQNIINMFSKQYGSIQTSPLGFSLDLKESTQINADNIGEFALPIVEYIRQTQPDYVVASDRGARLLGLAVFRLHSKLYGRFPTADGTIRFRRFSKDNAAEDTEKHLQPLVEEMLRYKERPTVLVLDDWVVSGATKKIAQQTFDKLSKGRIKTKFGVLIGAGADVSGHQQRTSGFAGVTDWHDNSEMIGVSYSGIKAQPVRSQLAKDYRKRMYQGITKLVDKITEKDADKSEDAVLVAQSA